MDNNKYDDLVYPDYENLSLGYWESYYGEKFPTITIWLEDITQVDIGIIHLTLSVISFILQLLIFTSFYNKKELFKSTCFSIIFHHGVLSFIQQICHIITAILTILIVENIKTLFVVIGSLLNSTYMGSVLFIFLLTLNRLDIIYSITVFQEEQKRKFYFFSIIFLYIWVIGLVIFYIQPKYGVTFNFYEFQWVYINPEDGGLGFQLENKTILIFLGLSFILQVFIIGKIFLLRFYARKRVIFAAENFRIVIHVILCFVTTLILELIWDRVFFDFPLIGYGLIIPQMLYIFSSVSNSIFVLFFVREIRANIIFLKFCKKNKKIKSKSNVKCIRTMTI
uniref:7TM_GPCR_Srx domain-containing protein n=1 Tax=Strongyloides papillosus TaxID=174720 RepID=A0A0N5C6I6_STREA